MLLNLKELFLKPEELFLKPQELFLKLALPSEIGNETSNRIERI